MEILGAPGGFLLLADKDVDAYREVFRARTATAPDYIQYGTRVGTILDEVTDQLLARPTLEGWDDPLAARFDEWTGYGTRGRTHQSSAPSSTSCSRRTMARSSRATSS